VVWPIFRVCANKSGNEKNPMKRQRKTLDVAMDMGFFSIKVLNKEVTTEVPISC
jgi:hypothetical protein